MYSNIGDISDVIHPKNRLIKAVERVLNYQLSKSYRCIGQQINQKGGDVRSE
jgi:hypothetical protein